jgi:hypothetical protein
VSSYLPVFNPIYLLCFHVKRKALGVRRAARVAFQRAARLARLYIVHYSLFIVLLPFSPLLRRPRRNISFAKTAGNRYSTKKTNGLIIHDTTHCTTVTSADEQAGGHYIFAVVYQCVGACPKSSAGAVVKVFA